MQQPRSLGFIEVPYYSITLMVGDYLAKLSNVELLGFEPLGDERILIRVGSHDASSMEFGLESCILFASRLGCIIVTSMLRLPAPDLSKLNQGPIFINGLYGGRDEMRPKTIMKTNQFAIGILETQGLTAMLVASDVMLKAADVQLVGKEKIGAAYVTMIIKGDVAAVTAAIEAGRQAVGELGKVIATYVIARPHGDLIALLPHF
jgi:carbon dioxide concentrating mechanism protein CcmO